MPGCDASLQQGGREGSSGHTGIRGTRRGGFLLLLVHLTLLQSCEIMFKSGQQTVKAPHAQALPPPPLLSCSVNLKALKRKQSWLMFALGFRGTASCWTGMFILPIPSRGAWQCHQPEADEAGWGELSSTEEEEEEGSLPWFVLGGSHGGKRSFPPGFSALTLSSLILGIARYLPQCADTH